MCREIDPPRRRMLRESRRVLQAARDSASVGMPEALLRAYHQVVGDRFPQANRQKVADLRTAGKSLGDTAEEMGLPKTPWRESFGKLRHSILRNVKRKLRCALLLSSAFIAPTTWGQQQQVNCAGEDFAYAWQLNITVTDSDPAPIASRSIATIIDNTDFENLKITKSGESLSGITDSQPVAASWGYFLGPNANGSGSSVPTCTLAFESYSLLAASGAASGSRITRYTMTIDPNTGNVTGTVQYESHDLAGAVANTANGAFTGALTGQLIDIASDPYWSALQPPLRNCSTSFPESFVPFTSVYYLSKPNAAGDQLLVGNPAQAPGPDELVNWETIQSLPLPTFNNEQFCSSVTLAAGYSVSAYVPTAAEKAGDFGSFSGLLIDPTTMIGPNGTPFPGGIIPTSRLGGIFAWRVPAQPALPNSLRGSHRTGAGARR